MPRTVETILNNSYTSALVKHLFTVCHWSIRSLLGFSIYFPYAFDQNSLPYKLWMHSSTTLSRQSLKNENEIKGPEGFTCESDLNVESLLKDRALLRLQSALSLYNKS